MKRKFASLILAFCLLVTLFPAEAMAAGGEGTEERPYLISSLAELEAFRDAVNNGTDTGEGKYFKLTEDIDLSAKYNAVTGESWEQIGTGEDEHYNENTGENTYGDTFQGTFDGGGHTIRGLYIYKTGPGGQYGLDAGALFGIVDGGTIQNLNVQGHVSVAATGGTAAGIAVTVQNGAILNCTFDGVVECPNYVAAGITTNCDESVILDCKTSGSITAMHLTGGIVGTGLGNSTIRNCVNESEIVSTIPIGGIAGAFTGSIEGCVNKGSVTGRTYTWQYEDEAGVMVSHETTSSGIGGIVGMTSENGVVNNCRNTGAVAGNTETGGICGRADKGEQESEDRASITNCLNTGSVTSTQEADGEHTIGSIAGTIVSQIWDHDADAYLPGAVAADVENCYYLAGTAEKGIGACGDAADTTAAKTAGELASGETAYLLQGVQSARVWGQSLPGGSADETPVLTDSPENAVYKLAFMTDGAEHAVKYANPSGPATLPADPAKSGYTFGGWYKEESCTNKWNFTTDTVTADRTLYAKWTKKNPTPTPGTPTPTPIPGPDEPVITVDQFADVKSNAWYYGAVKYAVDHGLFYGTSENIFTPNGDMTRGMFATVLYRLAEEPGTADEDLFGDVADGKYYSEAIAWAAENNMIAGHGNGEFGPDDPITREQLAAMLWRYAGNPVASGTLDSFTDGGKASGYALEALRWAVGEGILAGKGNGVLDPKGQATRAEVATMLMRYCEKF